jgi:uncharacterized membrane protein
LSDPNEQWFCYRRGEQLGPISQAELERWIAEGRLGPEDLLWREGMPNWAPAAAAAPEHFVGPGVAQAGAYAVNPAGLTNVPPPPGGEARDVGEITAAARERLRGDWGLPIGFSVLFVVISFAVGAVPYLGSLVWLFVGPAFMLGEIIFFLNYVRRGQAEIGQMFKGFERFGAALGAYLLIGLLTLLGYLALIVPGVILTLMFSQTFYILADDRSYGVWDAMMRSKQIMHGHKLRLFELHLRMFLWSLACLLTCGIGYIWLLPYYSASLAIFYDDLPKSGAYPVVVKALPAEMAGPAQIPAE